MIPLAATALVPLVVFPLAGVESAAEVSVHYMHRTIVLFMGGFFLAMALQKWGLHRRIALTVAASFGTGKSRLVLGFMVATGVLSMGVSNTATTMMMFPIGMAVVQHLREWGLRSDSALPSVLMLGIAYGASIGGVGTIIGTPPNLILVAQLSELFPERPPISFVRWMMVGLPFVAVFLPLGWWYLTRVASDLHRQGGLGGAGYLRDQLEELGPMGAGEWGVGIVFLATALAWVFRGDLPMGGWTLPGWASLLGVNEYVDDSTVAILSALVLFCTPVDWKNREFLLDWEWARRIPWEVLILFGGGIALAGGFERTGLARWIGEQLEVFAGLPVVLLILIVCGMLTFLTEVTSNTATSTIFMPVLGSLALSMAVAPELLMIPAAISASCAFMLPVATPPNAIVFGSEYRTVPLMARVGPVMNLIGVVWTTMLVYGLAVPLFGLAV